jgi:hypothetical protein
MYTARPRLAVGLDLPVAAQGQTDGVDALSEKTPPRTIRAM